MKKMRERAININKKMERDKKMKKEKFSRGR